MGDGQQTITQKTKDWATQSPLKHSEGWTHVLYQYHLVLLHILSIKNNWTFNQQPEWSDVFLFNKFGMLIK